MRLSLVLILLLSWPHVELADADEPGAKRTSKVAPVFLVADGLNADGSLIENYQRGLRYAVNYFGNYGPYYIYLLGPDSEASVRAIYRKRAIARVNPAATITAEHPSTRSDRIPASIACLPI